MKKSVIVVLAVISLLTGLGWCSANYRGIVPSLNGNAYSILSVEQGLFMVLSDEQNNCLVRLDETGNLLNFCRTKRSEAFQYLEAVGDTAYAIQNTYINRQVRQSLVSFSLAQISMNPQMLHSFPKTSEISWKELYPPIPEAEPLLLAVGIDSENRGWLFTQNLTTKESLQTPILQGESIYQLKYVEPERYLYIDKNGHLGQYDNGKWNRNILGGLAQTPMHISTCGTRAFVSDSATGDIFEIYKDASVSLYRKGNAPLGEEGFAFQDLSLFTTRDRGGEIKVVGLCINGSNSVVIEEGKQPIKEIHMSAMAITLLFGRYILLWFIGSFLVLLLLYAMLRLIIASRRVLIRMMMSTVLVTALLLAGIMIAQRELYLDSLTGDALEKFKLVSRNITEAIQEQDTAALWPKKDEVHFQKVERRVFEQHTLLRSRVTDTPSKVGAGMENVRISILYFEQNSPYIYYDSTVPWGYEVRDIKKREYIAALSRAITAAKPITVTVRTDILDELLFVESFWDAATNRKGCIIIEQPVADATADVSELDDTMRIYLILGPLLLLVLLLIYWRFLRPLKDIKAAMDLFYESGSGNQIFLRDGMTKDEFYDISRTFNKLSMETRVQMNQLNTINGAYARFVPDSLLKALGKGSVQEIHAGDSVQLEGGILIAAPRSQAATNGSPDRYLSLWSGEVAKLGGLLIDYDESNQAVTALFPSGAADALHCAVECCKALQKEGLEGILLVHGTSLMFGVWGVEDMFLPLAISEDLRRLLSALPVLKSFGCTVTLSGKAVDEIIEQQELRPLGVLSGVPLIPIWEAFTLGEPGLSLRRRKTLPLFQKGLELFAQKQFYESERLFVRILREDPEDAAAKWYLFRCEELHHHPDVQQADIGIG